MPLFSTNIGIAAVSSGSQFTQSFDVINVFVPSSTYGVNSTSASVASATVAMTSSVEGDTVAKAEP